MAQTESVGLAVAFAAGLLSFLSPCVLPLIPSYVTFITGMSLDELTEGRGNRRGVLVHGALFVLGFTIVFVTLGASATFLGSLFAYASRWVERVGGVVLILFGLYLLELVRLPGAAREWRVHLSNKPLGYLGTTLVGVTFGAGWTPCIGPVLGGILTLAATRDSLGDGIGLLLVYSAGLAIPFLLTSVAFTRMTTAFAVIKRHYPVIMAIGGAILIVFGVSILTGWFDTFNRWAQDLLDSLGINWSAEV